MTEHDLKKSASEYAKQKRRQGYLKLKELEVKKRQERKLELENQKELEQQQRRRQLMKLVKKASELVSSDVEK